MTKQLNKYTKAELLDYISEMEADHKHAIENKDDEIKDLRTTMSENKSSLQHRIDEFGDRIKNAYPDLHDNLQAALENRMWWLHDPPTGTVEACVPAGATHVRWIYEVNQLEFKFSNYWAQPLPGDIVEHL